MKEGDVTGLRGVGGMGGGRDMAGSGGKSMREVKEGATYGDKGVMVGDEARMAGDCGN